MNTSQYIKQVQSKRKENRWFRYKNLFVWELRDFDFLALVDQSMYGQALKIFYTLIYLVFLIFGSHKKAVHISYSRIVVLYYRPSHDRANERVRNVRYIIFTSRQGKNLQTLSLFRS